MAAPQRGTDIAVQRGADVTAQRKSHITNSLIQHCSKHTQQTAKSRVTALYQILKNPTSGTEANHWFTIHF